MDYTNAFGVVLAAIGLVSDDQLFAVPPPNENCVICTLILPNPNTAKMYMSCCGKIICTGCIHQWENAERHDNCVFCRAPSIRTNENQTADEIAMERLHKRINEHNDPNALYYAGVVYRRGLHGVGQNDENRERGYQYYLRAARLGSKDAFRALGDIWAAVPVGSVVGSVDGSVVGSVAQEPQAPLISKLFYKHAAIRGQVKARYLLAMRELRDENFERCIQHLRIACIGGSTRAMKFLRLLHERGRPVPQELLTEADQHHRTFLASVRSEQRAHADRIQQRVREIQHVNRPDDEPYDN
jgi:TPR repeat protein